MAVTYKKEPLGAHRVRERWSQLSGANAAQTCSTDPSGATRAYSQPRELEQVTVHYNAAVSAVVSITLNSGVGSAYDTVLGEIELAGEQDGFFIPEKPVKIMGDDVIDVLAPAGGAGVKSGVAIITELDET